MNARTCVIFGGTGCIGSHLAYHFLRRTSIENVFLADIRPVRLDPYTAELRNQIDQCRPSRVRFVHCDVRQPIVSDALPHKADLIVNLAAVHREPGHEPREYYETNLPGADNVCDYATRADCPQIVFTSSIAPYGPADGARDENSIPTPDTAYGGSKLVAETIHRVWQQARPGRKLIVLRPGVVFGPGEHANVARLARSLSRGYFVYMGNRFTRKAGVYVKELCSVVEYAIDLQRNSGDSDMLWNVSMDPPPTLEEYVRAICAVMQWKQPKFSVPRAMLVAASYPVAGVAQLFGIQQPINPVRMKKLSQPTHIEPLRLRQAGYKFRYTLEAAVSDWRQDAPEDF